MKYSNDDIVVLKTTDGEDVSFVQIGSVIHNRKLYGLLKPIGENENLLGEDEALVFLITRNDDGSENFTIVLDENICEEVFNVYNSYLD